MTARPEGLLAIEAEMVRQAADARASFDAGREAAAAVAASLGRTGRLLLLGMGGSHAVGRAVEPAYRALGIEAVATPLSEQLAAPLRTAGRTVLVTSQSGESAEVVRWFAEGGGDGDVFGLTLEGGSFLARTVPALVGAGGSEKAFAATRSLTISLAQHLAILAALGLDDGEALAALEAGDVGTDIAPALAALDGAAAVVTSGRLLRGLAEAIGLGFAELARLPAFSLEGGQLRHGPMEMLSPDVAVLHLRGDDTTAGLIGMLAEACVEAGARTVVLDASGLPPVAGAVTLAVPRAAGMAAIFRLLPVAQRLMVAFAAARVPDVGTPRRTTKITRTE